MGKMLSDVLILEYSKVLAIAFTMVDNDADAQDLIQDLAEKILRNNVPATTYQKPLAYFSNFYSIIKVQSPLKILPIEHSKLVFSLTYEHFPDGEQANVWQSLFYWIILLGILFLVLLFMNKFNRKKKRNWPISICINESRSCRQLLQEVWASPTLYLPIFVVAFSGAVNFLRGSTLYSDCIAFHSGYVNAFIFSHTFGNGITLILAPMLASIPAYVVFSKTNAYKNIHGYKQHSDIRIMFFAALFSGTMIILSYSLYLVVCCLLDPSISPALESVYTSGLYSNVYKQSGLLYCMAFILHAAFFGIAYGAFQYTLLLLISNKCFAIVFPTIIYYLVFMYHGVWFNATIFNYFIPALTFEISSFTTKPIYNYSQLLSLIIMCLLIIVIRKRRNLRKSTALAEVFDD